MSLYNYYKEQAKAPAINENNPLDCLIENEYNQIQNNIFTTAGVNQNPVSLSEIVKFIKRWKNKRSSRYDQVFNHMIKLLPRA